MRNADRFDLAQFDLSALDLPATGERTIRDTTASALALRLRAGGSRTWVLIAPSNGKTVRRSLGDATAIPIDVARQLASEPLVSESASDPDKGFSFTPNATVTDLLPRYLAFGAKGRWKPSTGRQMESVGRTSILPFLGDQKIRDLSRQDVAGWHREIAARTSSARMALSTLSGMMLFAEDHGLRPCGSNPCRGLRKKTKGHPGRALPTGSLSILWQALDRLQIGMPDHCDAVRLLLLTGARRCEILGLTWDMIVGARAVLEDSKCGPRTIWLNAPARKILDARRERICGAHVFPARRGGPLLTMDRQWRAILDEAGLSGIRLHDLRHHFASIAVSSGVDIRLLGQLLGHRNIDSTLGYADLATGAIRKSANRVSTFIDRSMTGTGARAKRRPRFANPPSPVERGIVGHGAERVHG